MSNNENNNKCGIRQDGYQPSERVEKGYKPTASAVPTTLPTTGSSVTQPSATSDTGTGNNSTNGKDA